MLSTVRGLFSFPGLATRFVQACRSSLAWQVGVVLVGSTGSHELLELDEIATAIPPWGLLWGRRYTGCGERVKDEGGRTRLQSCHGRADFPDASAWHGGDMRNTKRARSKQQPGCRHVDGVGLGMGMTDGATSPELPALYGFPLVVVRR